MSATRKSWGEHSDRWKREARKEGLTPARWNRWRHLPETTRKEIDPRRYAKGESVLQQRHSKLQTDALTNMKDKFPDGRESTMRKGVDAMDNRQLRWTRDASFDDLMGRASSKHAPGERNPWWYR